MVLPTARFFSWEMSPATPNFVTRPKKERQLSRSAWPRTEKKEETTFVDVTLWGRQAEIAGQYLHKGSPVFIEGRLQMDSWVRQTER
jgi:single stranded DNA-binding protein